MYGLLSKEEKRDLQIAKIFQETADNEYEHAKRFYKFLPESLNGEPVEIAG